MPPIVVTGLATTAVKGTRLRSVEQIELGPAGVRDNRRFFVIDRRDRMLNGKQLGGLTAVLADYAPLEQRLTLTFPDGQVVDGQVALDAPVAARFFSRTLPVLLVQGPWADALSSYLGQPLRLAQAGDSGVDRGRRGAASLISRASLERLAQAAGEDQVDGRRFRMLIEIDGISAHAEDEWVGTRLGVGEAVLAIRGHVGRCLVTSRDPDSGTIDLPTLDFLGGYRRGCRSTEPLPFGIYGEVISAGPVTVGDLVVPVGSTNV